MVKNTLVEYSQIVEAELFATVDLLIANENVYPKIRAAPRSRDRPPAQSQSHPAGDRACRRAEALREASDKL
jgi:hypothetical protein